MDDRRIARQPIFDGTDTVVSYELLFRGVADLTDDDEKTLQTMAAALLEFGLDKIVGSKQGWINCTTAFLVERQYELLPADRVVLEVLEHQLPTDELRIAIGRARAAGYQVALDDYGRDGIHAELVHEVDIVKVDLQLEGALSVIADLTWRGVTVVAEKVETRIERQHAAGAGAKLFQGFFYSEPEILEHRQLGPASTSTLRLMMLLGGPDADLDALVEALSQDAVLATRVLRAANAAAFGLPRRVESVREAVVYLGVEQVRRLILLMLFSGLRSSPPDELIRLAVSRAELCSQLADRAQLAPEAAHTAGLLSVLDALLGHTVAADDLYTLGMSDTVIEGLIERVGPFGEVLVHVDRSLGIEDGPIPEDVTVDTVAALHKADTLVDAMGS